MYRSVADRVQDKLNKFMNDDEVGIEDLDKYITLEDIQDLINENKNLEYRVMSNQEFDVRA